jgi:DNA-binding NtrC family response regulator
MSPDDLEPQAGAGKEGASAGPLRVLFVEDHPDTRASMEILLRRSGHYVQSAETAYKALELAAREKFDVVVTDIGLPDVSGTELMKELHSRYGLEGIAISGFGEIEEIERSGAEFLHHLTKPIKMDELRDLLAELQIMKGPDA